SPILVEVTLGEIRGITITVLGEVKKPGQYTFNTTISSIFNVLSAAGGLTPLGSMREIVIRRPGGKTEKVDLYTFDIYTLLKQGKIDEKLFHLQDGDMVIVPPKRRVVTVIGEIKRPGTYELKEGETLKSLVEIAGGVTPKANLKRVHILRSKGVEKTKYFDVDFTKQKDFELLDGDQIEFVAKPETRRMEIVEIKGEGVKSPGIYEFKEGMTVRDLVSLANGLYEDAITDSAVFVRTNKDFSLSFSTINLEEALKPELANKYKLQPLDKLVVFSKFYQTGGEKYVKITGHVKEPGRYPLSYKMTLYDLIYMAGGFNDEDFLKETYLERGDIIRKEYGEEINIPFNLGKLLKGDKNENHLLVSNDVVRIYSVKEIEGEKTVSIKGHVKHPGTYTLRKNMRVNDLLFLAGGFTDPDFRKKTYLERAEIIRLDPNTQKKTIIPFNLGKVLEGDQEENLLLQSLDTVVVYAFDEFQDIQRVFIQGEVRSPGEYELTENMTLTDLISIANGLTELADPNRIEVARFPYEGSSEDESAKVFVVSLAGGANNEPFFLKNRDRVIVRRKTGLQEPEIVEITGEVAYPGTYVLRDRTETITELIQRAGGFLDGADPEAAVLIRHKLGGEKVHIDLVKALKNPNSTYDIPLMDGDEIHIPKQNLVVKVEGEVLFPGVVQYVKGKNVSYYIDFVGGFNKNADKSNTVVIYPNGEVKRAKRLLVFSRKVKPGCTIFVPSKEKFERYTKISKAPFPYQKHPYQYPESEYIPTTPESEFMPEIGQPTEGSLLMSPEKEVQPGVEYSPEIMEKQSELTRPSQVLRSKFGSERRIEKERPVIGAPSKVRLPRVQGEVPYSTPEPTIKRGYGQEGGVEPSREPYRLLTPYRSLKERFKRESRGILQPPYVSESSIAESQYIKRQPESQYYTRRQHKFPAEEEFQQHQSVIQTPEQRYH
ncbi:SLBB domain-containing protein, partial [Candidatus Sumerlaeota bacterium]|nr:SLBB domain-containing protein [Candidatus Sumerlaeota bacterium]